MILFIICFIIHSDSPHYTDLWIKIEKLVYQLLLMEIVQWSSLNSMSFLNNISKYSPSFVPQRIWGIKTYITMVIKWKGEALWANRKANKKQGGQNKAKDKIAMWQDTGASSCWKVGQLEWSQPVVKAEKKTPICEWRYLKTGTLVTFDENQKQA